MNVLGSYWGGVIVLMVWVSVVTDAGTEVSAESDNESFSPLQFGNLTLNLALFLPALPTPHRVPLRAYAMLNVV